MQVFRPLFFCLALSVGSPAVAELRVVDGDTLELDGVTYRLNGIDAPEHGQRCGDWDCGAAATAELARLIAGTEVTCYPIEEDGHGRVVATCLSDGRDLSAEMIDKGLAWAFTRYSDAYEPQELVSKDKAQGVFSKDFLPPWEYRALRWKRAEAEEQDAPANCPIKGNISINTGEKIYHTPWSPWYARTFVNTSKGERWFCSEGDAVASGWRAPRWK